MLAQLVGCGELVDDEVELVAAEDADLSTGELDLSTGDKLPSAVAVPAEAAAADAELLPDADAELLPDVELLPDGRLVDAATDALPELDTADGLPAVELCPDVLALVEELSVQLGCAVSLLVSGPLPDADGLPDADATLAGVEILILWVGGRELTGGRTLVTSTTTGSGLSCTDEAPSR